MDGDKRNQPITDLRGPKKGCCHVCEGHRFLSLTKRSPTSQVVKLWIGIPNNKSLKSVDDCNYGLEFLI